MWILLFYLVYFLSKCKLQFYTYCPGHVDGSGHADDAETRNLALNHKNTVSLLLKCHALQRL